MKQMFKTAFISVVLTSIASSAQAYNFGLVRAPDWMDVYVLGVLVLLVPFWIGTYVTKPKHVPFNQLYRTKLEPLNAFFYITTLVVLIVLLVLVFVGMTLARM